jgi:hypothetical protein
LAASGCAAVEAPSGAPVDLELRGPVQPFSSAPVPRSRSLTAAQRNGTFKKIEDLPEASGYRRPNESLVP